jgi:hypothetical protein
MKFFIHQITIVFKPSEIMKKLLFFYYAGIIVAGTVNSQTIPACFNALHSANSTAVGSYPMHLITADFNNDGKLDVATANYGSDNVSVLLCISPGVFATAVSYSSGTNPYSIASADFNGDGKTDLAVANYGSNNMSVLLGSATGTFASAVNYGAGTGPMSITAADFNGDGKADVALANNGSGNVSILLGSGTGTFAAAVNYGSSTGPSQIISNDFNLDGKVDLAVANAANNVSVLLGSGTGTFAAAVNYGVGSLPQSITSADFNGDGKSDLAVGNKNSGNVSVLLGSGTGTFAAAVNYTIGSQPVSITSGDFNGDSKADLAMVNPTPYNVTILIGSGTGNFAQPVNYGSAFGSTAARAADLDGDNKLYLVTCSGTANNVSILWGSGTGTLIAMVSYTTGITPHSVVQADFNGDGNADLATANNTSNDLSILFGSASGTFATPVNYGTGTGPVSIITKDFNSDGKADLAVANNNSNNVSILLGSATGTFGAAANYGVGASPRSVCSADFNGDGNPDLAVTNSNASNLSILMGSGTGTFASATYYAVGTNPNGITTGDFNQDGKTDLAVANLGSNSISILLGSGTGTFASAVNYIAGSGPISIISSDFNTDGNVDLAEANGVSSNVSLLLGSGTGTFGTASNYTLGMSPRVIVLGDFNADGKNDLAIVCSAKVSILLSSGTGTFNTTGYNLGSDLRSICSGDFNNDGKTDLAVSDITYNKVTILHNQSIPTLTVSSSAVICSGNSISLSATGAQNYSWSTGALSGSVSVSPIVTTGYTVTGTNLIGCSNTTVRTITVNPSPTITINSGTVCYGQNFTLTPGGASTYSYSGGAAVVNPTANTNYSVLGTNSLGCISATAAVSSLTVKALPVILVNSGAICTGQSFTISPAGANTYTYSGGSAVVSPTATTGYSITGTSTAGCISSSAAVSNVTVNSLPVISANSGSICSGQSFTIVPSGASTYTYTGGSPIVTPVSNASYSVTGTTTAGCVSASPAVSGITVHALPVISVNSGSVCSGQSFTLVPSGAITYSYTGGSAVVSPVSNASYSITGTSTAGCVSATPAISNVTVLALPSISVNSGSVCNGQSFTITPAGANTYTFSSGTAVVNPATTTAYSVIGTSTAGCVSVPAILNVTVNALPAISVNSGTICLGQSFIISPGGASTYTYSGGSATVTPQVTSIYSITGTSSAGCLSPAAAICSVIVNPIPFITVTSSKTKICAGETATLISGGAASYSWNTGALTSSLAINPSTTTTYSVLGVDLNGCQNSVALTLTVNPLPIVTASATSTLVCSGTTAALSGSGASVYSWSGGVNNNIPFLVFIAATYSVTGVDLNGCSNTASIFIQTLALPQLSCTTSDSIICVGEEAMLTVDGAVSYTWSTSQSSASMVVSPTITTSYTVTGIGNNGCSNASAITQIVNPCLEVNQMTGGNSQIAVYPNPTNGEFFIRVENGNALNLSIYNIEGQGIFSTTLHDKTSAVDFSAFANGIYFIEIWEDGFVTRTKLIKQ